MYLTFIFWLLNLSAAADSQSYFHFKCPSLHLSGTAFSHLSINRLHLIGRERPVWPMKINIIYYITNNILQCAVKVTPAF